MLEILVILGLSGQSVHGVDARVAGQTERFTELPAVSPQSSALLLQLGQVLRAPRAPGVGTEYSYCAQELQQGGGGRSDISDQRSGHTSGNTAIAPSIDLHRVT